MWGWVTGWHQALPLPACSPSPRHRPWESLRLAQESSSSSSGGAEPPFNAREVCPFLPTREGGPWAVVPSWDVPFSGAWVPTSPRLIPVCSQVSRRRGKGPRVEDFVRIEAWESRVQSTPRPRLPPLMIPWSLWASVCQCVHPPARLRHVEGAGALSWEPLCPRSGPPPSWGSQRQRRATRSLPGR